MNSTNIKELKGNFRSYLDKVSQGEKVIITDHGKEVALLAPIPSEFLIRSLIDAKKAKWSGGKPVGIKGIPIKGKLLSGTILKERR